MNFKQNSGNEREGSSEIKKEDPSFIKAVFNELAAEKNHVDAEVAELHLMKSKQHEERLEELSKRRNELEEEMESLVPKEGGTTRKVDRFVSTEESEKVTVTQTAAQAEAEMRRRAHLAYTQRMER